MIEKETEDGPVTLTVQIRDDEERPVKLLMQNTESGCRVEMELGQDDTQAMSKWLQASLDLLRWC